MKYPLDTFHAVVTTGVSVTATIRGNLFAQSVYRTIPWALTKGCLLKPLSHLHCSLTIPSRPPTLLKNLPLNFLLTLNQRDEADQGKMGGTILNGRNAESSGPCVVCRNFKHTTLIYSYVRFVCLRMLSQSVYEWGIKGLKFLGVLWQAFWIWLC